MPDRYVTSAAHTARQRGILEVLRLPVWLILTWLTALAATSCGTAYTSSNGVRSGGLAPAGSGQKTASAPAGGTSQRPGAAAAAAAGASAGRATADPAAILPVTGDLTVFAASSLTDVFNEIGVRFQSANPAARITFNFAASSTLRAQLQHGARADVFASADESTMDGALNAGSIDGSAQVFARNRLIVIYPASNPGKIGTIQDLARPGLKVVLADRNVPIGAYARQSLQNLSTDPVYGAGFAQKVLANLRSEETNVRAVVSKVQLGEADAAIVYATEITPAVAKDVKSIAIPDQFNVLATYPIALVKDAPNRSAGQAFVTYVRSPAGQAVLKQYGFIVDGDTGAARALAP